MIDFGTASFTLYVSGIQFNLASNDNVYYMGNGNTDTKHYFNYRMWNVVVFGKLIG